MKGLVTMARAIPFVVALSILIPAYATMTLLTEGLEMEQTDDTNNNEDKSLLPFTNLDTRKKKRNPKKNKEVLSLLWKDGDPSPFSFSPKAIRPHTNPLASFWGGIIHHHRHRNNVHDDRQRIEQTLRKFYRLADPKFARASLSIVRDQYIATIEINMQLPGVFQEELDQELESISENDSDDEDEDLQPGTLLKVYTKTTTDEEHDETIDETPVRLEDYAFELLEKMQQELGETPQHYMDFAYRAVTGSSSSTATSNQNKGGDLLIDSDEGECLTQDEESCRTMIATQHKASRKDGDKKGPFFASWWKKWRAFANSQWWKNTGSSKDDYDIGKTPFAGGSIGEVWKGRRRCNPKRRTFHKKNNDDEYYYCDDQTPLVLKRLRIERGYELLEAGLREVYFGKLIARVLEDNDMYTVYVDHFFREVPKRNPPTRASSRAFGGMPKNGGHRTNDLELWIVYEDAGPSLRSYIYTPVESSNGFIIHQHSKLWTKLRTYTSETSEEEEDQEETSSANEQKNRGRKVGRMFLQKTLRQILSAAAELHQRGIVHRDIKPSNVMCQADESVSLEEIFESEKYLSSIVCKLGDFSSGWDRYTSEHLYSKGPTPGEQTDEYAPPESYVGPYWKPFDENKPQTYDSWSIGVLALELLLGTPNVFSVDQRTSALLTMKLKRARASEEEIAHTMYLAALSNFCIFVPSSETANGAHSWPLRYGDPLHKTTMVKESCTLQDFHHALRARDPLGIGFDSSTDLLLHLIWQLLTFDPNERITAEEALSHPFFTSPDGTLDSLNEIPGNHNALISEILDARIDLDVEDEVTTFQCPTCGRVFHDWSSCHQHANMRKHAKFCVYNHTVLPSCVNTHSMLPEHDTSGYCDLQGRRKTIEDFHSIHLHHEHQFYGIFDGHTGNLASKFAASELYTELLSHLPDLMRIDEKKSLHSSQSSSNELLWKEEIRVNVTKAFESVHERFLDRIAMMTSAISEVGSAPKMDQSGTTATALLVTDEVVIAAVLGDSRGVLAATNNSHASSSVESNGKNKWKNFPVVSPIQLSIDHVASDPTEKKLVLQRGGTVSESGDIARVNGTLAITRSIGDESLSPILSREPHVRIFDRTELRELCGNLNGGETAIPCFAILASDGLWDVMSNQEAVDMVVDIMLHHNEGNILHRKSSEIALLPSSLNDDDDEESGGPFQKAAERLAVEAYVRGSTDNIGVCVVAID